MIHLKHHQFGAQFGVTMMIRDIDIQNGFLTSQFPGKTPPEMDAQKKTA